jgi:FtsP/CotA-like multicopper oxidase with cupredoxin domain
MATAQATTASQRFGARVLIIAVADSLAFIHPMHIHGGPFRVIARDGETLPPAAR